MSNRNRSFAFALVAAAFLALTLSTTGCKKDDDPIIVVQPDVGGTHYYAADMYGDLVNVQMNPASGLYSYLQLEGPSPIGVGQDTITPATGLGSGAYHDSDGIMWALNPDKFVAMGGFGNIVMGVPVYSSTYPATVIAGMYNWLSMDYFPADDSATVDYGTLQINAGGTWEIWTNIDGTTWPASSEDTGTWTDNGNGLLSIMSDGSGGAKIGNIAIYPSVNGNILVMNYAVSTPFGMVYGIIIGLPQAPVNSGDLDGTYDAIPWDGLDFSEVVVSGTDITVDGGGTQAVNLNDPWDGILLGSDFYVIGSQDGLAVTIVENISGDDEMIINVLRQP